MRSLSLIALLVGCFALAPVAASEPRESGSPASQPGPAGGALERPFESPWETRNFKTGAGKTARNCRELLALPAGFAPETEIDYRAFLFSRVRCRALAALAGARPARADHLGPFPLDDAHVAELPAALMPVVGPRARVARIEKLSSAGKTWKDVEAGLRVTETREGLTYVEGKESEASLEILGHGDVNGDGLEDLVILRAGGGKGGTATLHDVFVITRKAADARVEVVRRIKD